MQTRKPREMSADERMSWLSSIIDAQIRDAADFDAEELGVSRAKALKYFLADETLGGDVPAQKNRSTVVSRDIADVCGWLRPSLTRVFAGSDRVVMYEARRKAAEEMAQQATDYVNYLFKAECNGYVVLYDAFWEALVLGKGIIKHWWDDTPEYRVEKMTDVPEKDYIELVSDPQVEVLEHSAREADPPRDVEAEASPGVSPTQVALPAPQAPQMPQMMNGGDPTASTGMQGGGMVAQPNGAALPSMMPLGPPLPPPMVHDLKIKRRIHNGRLRIMAIPQEEFRIDRHATRIDEEHVRFCAHVSLVTRSSMIADGYDPDLVDGLKANTTGRISTSAEADIRGDGKEGDKAPDKSTELIEKWECYIQLDWDGDGQAEWRRVVAAEGADNKGHSILLNEEWGDGIPFTDVMPDPIPHNWGATSLYDELGDIQRRKTVFHRGINDNLYWTNNPQRWYLENQIGNGGLDKLVSPDFGDAIPVRDREAIGVVPVPFVADKIAFGIELADKDREFRTGVSPSTMSLDPEALANQTATAVNTAKTSSYTRIEEKARNIAEYGGLTRLFQCVLRTLVQHQGEPRQIKLRGEWVDMDPRGWDADMDVIINVGLGSGSRDRDLAMLQAVAMKQELVVQAFGPQVAVGLGLGPDVIFRTYRQMVEASGLKSPESYFPEIKPEQIQAIMAQQAQQPDPKMAESQAKIQAMQMETQAKLQADRERMAAETQAKQQQAALDWQHRQQQADIDNQHRARELEDKAQSRMQEIQLSHQLAIEQAQREFALKQQEMQVNAALKQRELEIEAELKREEMKMQPRAEPNIAEAQQ